MKERIAKLQDLYFQYVDPQVPTSVKATAMLHSFGLMKVPLLSSVLPVVMDLDNNHAVLKIPLYRRTKNHLGSMYFGALAIGADCVVGLLAMHYIRKKKVKGLHFSFKDFKADFLKRPMGDVHFICHAGKEIGALIDEAVKTGERMNLTVPAHAVVPSIDQNDPVAKFELTISIKFKKNDEEKS